MLIPSNAQKDLFRALMVCPSTKRVVVEPMDGAPLLPRVSIPRYARVAEQLQSEIEARWATAAIIIDVLVDPGRSGRLVLVELRGSLKDSGIAFARSIGDLERDELSSEELATSELLLRNGVIGQGSFSKLGWIDDALDWVATEAAVNRSEISCQVRQYNAGANYALIRFGQGPSAYWMKAACAPNLSELPKTLMLARLFPGFLPSIVASRTDWHAWLTRDAGEPFSECRSQHIGEQVTLRLAELQQASAVRIETLLAGGCPDQTLPILRAGIPAIVAYLEEAMAKQISLKSLPLSVPRLRELGRILEDACTSLEGLKIPVTLIHNDINASNILIRDNHVVFTDWAEACVGSPFITFEHLRINAARNSGSERWIPALTEAYKQSWRSMIEDTKIETAFSLLPLATPLSYLYGRGDWFTSPRRYDPMFEAHARSLARHIDRAALAHVRQRTASCFPSLAGSPGGILRESPMNASSSQPYNPALRTS